MLENIMLPEFPKLSIEQRRACIIAMTTMLTRSEYLKKDLRLWSKVLSSLVKLFSLPSHEIVDDAEHELEYHPSYHKLSSIGTKKSTANYAEYFKLEIKGFIANNGIQNSVMGHLGEEEWGVLNVLLA
jgi:hypothetical protein